MSSLTRRPAADSIRKLAAVLLLALLSGCATSGPNHLYFTTAAGPAIQDRGPAHAEIAGALAPEERVLGLAYDFNTDHLFLRIAPAQIIRVIERPSGKILREMPLPADLHTTAPADLAIRSGDRHLFAVHPDGRSVVELTLFGVFVRRLEFAGLDTPIGGLAYDQKNRRLLVLLASSPARVMTVTPEGILAYYARMSVAVDPVSLGYDSDAQRFYVPLANGHGLGEFDAAGRLIATHPAGGVITAIDAGPRSFVRVF